MNQELSVGCQVGGNLMGVKGAQMSFRRFQLLTDKIEFQSVFIFRSNFLLSAMRSARMDTAQA